jgi:hypothetical protein
LTGNVQEPLVKVALLQALVVDPQLTPERLQEPFVQVAVAEPENPEALLVTGVLCVCDKPLTGKEHDPLIKVVFEQGFVVEMQLTPERLQEPLVQVAVAEPENPDALFATSALCVCERPVTGNAHEPLVSVALEHGLLTDVHDAESNATAPSVQEARMDPE